jgi:hypothetical protein
MSSQDDGNWSNSEPRTLNRRKILLGGTTLAAASAMTASSNVQLAQAQTQPVTAASGKKPNIILIV